MCERQRGTALGGSEVRDAASGWGGHIGFWHFGEERCILEGSQLGMGGTHAKDTLAWRGLPRRTCVDRGGEAWGPAGLD